MNAITLAVVPSIPRLLPIRSEAVRPSTSALQFNGASEGLEMKDRNLKKNGDAAASISNLNGHHLRAGLQLASVCYSMFLAGWNDGTTGPLLPKIQKFYNVCPISLRHILHVTLWF